MRLFELIPHWIELLLFSKLWPPVSKLHNRCFFTYQGEPALYRYTVKINVLQQNYQCHIRKKRSKGNFLALHVP
jgi:hypothetical protein